MAELKQEDLDALFTDMSSTMETNNGVEENREGPVNIVSGQEDSEGGMTQADLDALFADISSALESNKGGGIEQKGSDDTDIENVMSMMIEPGREMQAEEGGGSMSQEEIDRLLEEFGK